MALAAVGFGLRIPGDWSAGERSMGLQDFAGEILRGALGGLVVGELTLEPKTLKGLDPSESARILLNGKVVGGCGLISQSAKKAFRSPDGLYALELDIEPLLKEQWTYRPINVPSRQPQLLRDLSIVLPAGASYSAVEKTLRSNAGEHLDSLRLYDLYTGKQVSGERFSLTFSLSFRATDRALTDDEINPVMERIIESLKTAHQAELRQ
jgi:phenylalanyl-tRNA synthetase beta chain